MRTQSNRWWPASSSRPGRSTSRASRGRRWTPRSRRRRPTTGFRIDGVKDRVEAGAESDVFLVVAQCDGELRQFLVPADASGVTCRAAGSIDLVKRYARVNFDGVEVDASAVVGSAEQTAALIARQSQVAQVLQCAEVVGILDTVLDFTIQWGFDRHSFGRPLASYQALKHKYADMKIWLEACRATTHAAVADVSARVARRRHVGQRREVLCGRTRRPGMLQHCVQLHGGIGVTWEHDLHLFLRRVTLYRSMFGTPEEHNLRVYALTEAAGVRLMTDTTSVADRDDRDRSRNSPRGPGPGWPTTCRASTRPTRPPPTAARKSRGCAPANCRRSSTKAVSPASASRASTAGSGCPSRTRRRSTTSPAATSCRSSSTRRRSRSARATILDTGTEEQKRQHISGALRGDEVLVQLLSEPSGGSDLAGVITRADRTGDKWVINGAKTWSTSAFAADYGLMLARTNWDVPKHEGLTMFLVPINSPGITMRRIKQVDGGTSSARSSSTTSNSMTTPWSVRSTTAGMSHRVSCTTSGARSAAARNSPAALGPKARPIAHRLRGAAGEDGPVRQRARPRDGGPRVGAPRRAASS